MHHLTVRLLAIIDQMRELDWTLRVFDPGLSDRCGYRGISSQAPVHLLCSDRYHQ